MTTWHQQQAMKRHFQAQRDARVPLTSPLAHPTKWTAVFDPPGLTLSVSTYPTAAEANGAIKGHTNAFVVPPLAGLA